MDLVFEIYKTEDGALRAEAQGYPILAKGENLQQLLSDITECLGTHFENSEEQPQHVSCVWREGESGTCT